MDTGICKHCHRATFRGDPHEDVCQTCDEIRRLREENKRQEQWKNHAREMYAKLEAENAKLSKVVDALMVVLDQVDYTKGAGLPTEMVGALLPKIVIENAHKALHELDEVEK